MSMTSINISLPEALKENVEAQTNAGGYSTVSEYLRELVRADQKRQAEAKLETMLLEGINSGPATPMTKDDWAAIRKTALERLAAKKSAA